MVTATTQGVTISVETFYQQNQSKPFYGQFNYAYRVTIKNRSLHTLQLKRRHWFIFDSSGIHREVEGDGVVGKQPILEPGQMHQYVSGCHLNTQLGSMHGTYEMERIKDGAKIEVNIPKFQLVAPYLFN